MSEWRSDTDPVSRHLAAGRRSAMAEPSIVRVAPDRSQIARRRRLVRLSKFLMPVFALLLLGSLALWPEVERALRVAQTSTRDAAALHASSGALTEAAYRGLDSHGRPYMITARTARQVSPERVDLVLPKADILSQSGAWLMLTADQGVYMTKSQLLDLSGNVVLYRDDGTFLTAPTATIDLKRGVDASNDWVHIEGPFGVLDAKSYFLSSHDGVLQFQGPARLVLNSTRHSS